MPSRHRRFSLRGRYHLVTATNLLSALLYFAAGEPCAGDARPVYVRAAWSLSLAALPFGNRARFPNRRVRSFPAFHHMLQHMLLMMIVPPLSSGGRSGDAAASWLAAWTSRRIFGSGSRSLPSADRPQLTYPRGRLLLALLAMIGWHLTAPYEFALRSPGWHEVEHACFLLRPYFLVARGPAVAQPGALDVDATGVSAAGRFR